MKNGKSGEISVGVHVWILLLGMSCQVSAEEIPDYSEIKAAVDASYETRAELLRNSTGVAKLFLKKRIEEDDNPEAYRCLVYDGCDVDCNAVAKTRYAPRTITWYVEGEKKRFDSVCPDSNDPRAILMESNRRTISDEQRSLIYDRVTDKVYRSPPLRVSGNPYGQLNSFDINYFYRFNLQTVSELLYRWFERETQSKRIRQITREKLGEVECIKVYCHSAYTYPSGKRGERMKVELWLAPEMSYSLVKARIWCLGPADRTEHYFLLESYAAKYEESKTHPGVWLLKTLDYVNNQAATEFGSEVLRAVFTDTKIGVDIPDEAFTPQGIGASAGKPIEDGTVKNLAEDTFGVSKGRMR